MDLKKINIMVIGSKPQNQLPNIDFDKIYAANGAAEVAYIYKKKWTKKISSFFILNF